jgi:hypothetical protein
MAQPRPEKHPESKQPVGLRVLPMRLQVGDQLTDETGEYEVIGHSYATNAGKDVHVRVQRVDNAEITMIRTWDAHGRVSGEHDRLPSWAWPIGRRSRTWRSDFS